MSYDSNMKEDILEEVKDELDSAIIIVTSDSDVSEKNRKFPKELINKPVMLKEVIDYFDYNFDSGYGGQECHSFYIWNKSEVFFIWEYDGSTHIHSIPRNPPSFSPTDTHNSNYVQSNKAGLWEG